ncbi:flippase [Candidatus Uhrbacteria bacterium]|nr:flippase [Candidatus Uhrbacteria bacterium]
MTLARSIIGNAAVQVLGKFAGTAIALVTVAIMTRHLKPEGYGAFTTVISYLQFFGTIVDFGLTLTMIRMISESGADEKKVASNILTIRVASGAVFFGIAPLIALLFPYSAEVKTGIGIATVSYLCIALSQVLIGVFQKHLEVRMAAVAEVSGRLVLLAGTALAAVTGAGLTAYIVALTVSNLAQFVLSVIFVRRLVPIRLEVDFGLWKKIISQSWPIGVSIIFNLIYLKGDVLVLSLYRPDAEIGLYGAAYKVLDVITVIPMIFMGLALSPLTKAWTSGNRADFSWKLGRAFDFLTMLALPIVFGTYAVADDLMALAAGADFRPSGHYLAILMIAGATVFWSGLFGHAVVALNLQRKMIWGYAADAAISLPLYFAFVPGYGALGAAWVTVFSEVLITIITTVVVLTYTKTRIGLGTFWRSAAASILMAAALVAIAPMPVLPRIAVGMGVYAALLYLFGAVTKEMLRTFFPRKV